jgi:hypothetical protein
VGLVAQWIRRLPTEQETLGSIPSMVVIDSQFRFVPEMDTRRCVVFCRLLAKFRCLCLF